MKKIALSALVIAASGAYVWSQAGTSDPLAAGIDIQTGSIAPQALPASASAMLTPRAVPFVTQETAVAPPAPADVQPLPPLPADPAPSAPTGPVAVAAADAPAVPMPPAPAEAAITVPMPRLRPPYTQVAAAAPTPAPASAPSSTRDPAASVSPLVRIAAATTGLRDGTFAGPVVDAYYGLMQIEAVIQNGRLASIHVLQYPNDRRTSIVINRQALPMLRDEVIQAQSANVDIISGATLSSEAFIQSLGAALDRARA